MNKKELTEAIKETYGLEELFLKKGKFLERSKLFREDNTEFFLAKDICCNPFSMAISARLEDVTTELARISGHIRIQEATAFRIDYTEGNDYQMIFLYT